MECLVCRETIQSGERIFFGNQCICRGDEDWEYWCSEDVEELVGAIHLFCLQSSIAATTSPNKVPAKLVEEESIVQRSDALAMFDV